MRASTLKLKNMASTTAFSEWGIIATMGDWSATLGKIPNQGQPSLLVNFE